MRSYLKEQDYELPNGELLKIRELSAGGRRQLIEASKKAANDVLLYSAITVKAGVPAFSGETVEDILDSMPTEWLLALAQAIMAMSGMQETEAQVEKN